MAATLQSKAISLRVGNISADERQTSVSVNLKVK